MILELELQVIFDRAVNGVLKQNAPAVDEKIGCLYFDEKTGNKCAVGQLISDEFRGNHPQLNDLTITEILDYDDRDYNTKASYFHHESIKEMLGRLQVAHDLRAICTHEIWLNYFIRETKRTAKSFKLHTKNINYPK